MMLNRTMVVILRYFTEFGSFGANHVKLVEVIPIVSVTKCSLQNLVLGNV